MKIEAKKENCPVCGRWPIQFIGHFYFFFALQNKAFPRNSLLADGCPIGHSDIGEAGRHADLCDVRRLFKTPRLETTYVTVTRY